jgi:hypothetical protein
MAFDRSKYAKKASRSEQAKIQKEVDEKSGFGGSRRSTFHRFEDGENYRRIIMHPKDFPISMMPILTAKLTCECPIYKDGEKTAETEVKEKNILNATVHGKGIDADPIDLYIKYVYEYANETYDAKDPNEKKEKEAYLKYLTGYRGPQGWVWGIKFKKASIAYAVNAEGDIARAEFWTAWTEEMDKIAARLEDSDDVMDTDPFSNPDEGYPIIINREKEGKKNVYTIYNKAQGRKESWDEYCEKHRVTDEQFMEIEKMKSLTELYRGVYKKSDFNFAIDGLERFDKAHGYGIFEIPEFIDELEKIEAQCPVNEREEIEEGKDLEKAFEKKEEKTEAKPSTKKAPAKRAPAKKAPAKKKVTGPTDEELTAKLTKLITNDYGKEWVCQIPTDRKLLEEWCKIVDEDRDLPITEEEEMEGIDVATEEVEDYSGDDIPEPQEEEAEEADGELDDDAMKKQLEAMRNRRKRK